MTAKLPDDFGRGDRFWYWRGLSGQRYIHSIYAADSCPPLPGAVYVAVRRQGNAREALAVGRFSAFLDGASSIACGRGVDEIHVHLLAGNESEAQAIFADLKGEPGETATRVPPVPAPAQAVRLAA